MFNACATLRRWEAWDIAKKISKEMSKVFYSNPQLSCLLLDALIKCGDIGQVQVLFNGSEVKSIQMYGAMMNGNFL